MILCVSPQTVISTRRHFLHTYCCSQYTMRSAKRKNKNRKYVFFFFVFPRFNSFNSLYTPLVYIIPGPCQHEILTNTYHTRYYCLFVL